MTISMDYHRLGTIVATAFLLNLLILSCGSKSTEENAIEPEAIAELDVAQQDTSPEAEIRRLTAQIRISPKDYDLYYRRSVNWYDAGNTLKAIEDMSKSIELNNMNPDAYYMRGFYYYVQNKEEEALKDLKQSIVSNTDNPEVFYLIGQIHFFKKEYPFAEDAYREAARIDSLEPIYSFALGFMEQERGNMENAIAYYEEALRKRPTFIKALSALHDIYLTERNRPDIAMAYNDRILMVDSTHPIGRFNMGNFFFNKANNITEEEKLPEFRVVMKLAISEYNRCIQYDPNFAQGYYNRGYSYYLIEQYERAKADFSTVIDLDPYNEKAFFMKASILDFQGDLDGALVNYQQAARLDPEFREASKAVREVAERINEANGSGLQRQ